LVWTRGRDGSNEAVREHIKVTQWQHQQREQYGIPSLRCMVSMDGTKTMPFSSDENVNLDQYYSKLCFTCHG
jgi:hypothetical protein